MDYLDTMPMLFRSLEMSLVVWRGVFGKCVAHEVYIWMT